MIHRRGSGGRGFIGGAGETEIELQRRRCANFFILFKITASLFIVVFGEKILVP